MTSLTVATLSPSRSRMGRPSTCDRYSMNQIVQRLTLKSPMSKDTESKVQSPMSKVAMFRRSNCQSRMSGAGKADLGLWTLDFGLGVGLWTVSISEVCESCNVTTLASEWECPRASRERSEVVVLS